MLTTFLVALILKFIIPLCCSMGRGYSMISIATVYVSVFSVYDILSVYVQYIMSQGNAFVIKATVIRTIVPVTVDS